MPVRERRAFYLDGNLYIGGSAIATIISTDRSAHARAPFSFFMPDIAAALTTVAMYNASYGTATTAQGSVYPLPAAATVRSFAVYTNGSATAGTATYTVVKNAAATNLSGAITTGTGTVITGGTTTFAAGDKLGVVVTTSADWNGTGLDASATVLVEF